MQVHSLELDDFTDIDYVLISIHTGLEDYKLAYLLNKHLNTFFEKSKNSLDFKEGEQNVSFSIYSYEDEPSFNNWYLISNKYQGVSRKTIKNGLFETANEVFDRTLYLIPEKKKTDYFVKIEGDFNAEQLSKTIDKIKNINQVVTSYSVDITTLKSKDFLIF